MEAILILLWNIAIFSTYAIHNENLGDHCVLSESYQTVKESFTVVIDAGHGGKDPGTSGRISKEKDIALAIALKVGEAIKLNNPQVNVLYTRTDDTFIPLFERVQIANREKADLFISIHCNATNNKRASGTETYVMGLHRAEENLEIAKRENSAILYEANYGETYDGFDPNSDAGHIILSMYQNTYLEQSIEFANFIENDLGLKTSRGVKQAGFVVLRKATMPSVLIETGFLTNEEEEKKLMSKYGQSKIAQSISAAFSKYYEVWNTTQSTAVAISSDSNSITGPEHIFTVQIAATSSLKESSFANVPQLYYRKEDNLYKYFSGEFKQRAKAIEAKKQLSSLGYPDAFIVQID